MIWLRRIGAAILIIMALWLILAAIVGLRPQLVGLP